VNTMCKKQSSVILNQYHSTCLHEMRKTPRNLSDIRGVADRDSNQEPLENKLEALPLETTYAFYSVEFK
jgi:hypothetical protein